MQVGGSFFPVVYHAGEMGALQDGVSAYSRDVARHVTRDEDRYTAENFPRGMARPWHREGVGADEPGVPSVDGSLFFLDHVPPSPQPNNRTTGTHLRGGKRPELATSPHDMPGSPPPVEGRLSLPPCSGGSRPG